MVYEIPGIRFQPQATPYWCWAAVAWMVLDCYTKGNGKLQCEIAGELTNTSCCPPPDGTAADPSLQPESLQKALAAVGHYGSGPIAPQPQDPQDFLRIKTEIIAQRPICAEMAVPGGNHFVVISACADDQSLRVLDPLGWYDTDFDTFTTLDQLSEHGYCTAWYLTS